MSARFAIPQELRRAAAEAHFCVKRFAALLGMGPRTLERRFREVFDCTPDCWLARERMRKAAILLQKGEQAKEAAAELGFQHSSSFYRYFRRWYGCTPAQFVRARRPSRNIIPLPLSQTATFLSQTATSEALPPVRGF